MPWSWRASLAISMGLILLSVEIAKPWDSNQGESINLVKPRQEHTKESAHNRKAKLINIIQIITFPNDPCASSDGLRNGTCYTATECQSKGGINGGTCASGFGVCCVFSIGCSSMANENCTYFMGSDAPSGSCSARICPCSSNICQFRLDFDSFVIAGPVTSSATSFTQSHGQTADKGNTVAASLKSNCLTDTFTVTNPGGSTPPVICGTNSGQHMYVDSSRACNDLTFQFGLNQNMVRRTWSIKVTQYSCSFSNLAPNGCTQYFFGATTSSVQTFNYNGGNGHHLANQDQTICVRRERGNCRLCWSAIATTDFMISGVTKVVSIQPVLAVPTITIVYDSGPIATGFVTDPLSCCGYGQRGDGTKSYDCVIIPGARNNANVVKVSRYCGRQKLGAGGTRCTTFLPFMVRFMSDGFEITGANTKEAFNMDAGFSLVYLMDANNCV